MVATAVLHQIGVIRVTGAELVLDGLVVLGLGVGVLYQQADGCTGGYTFEHAGEYPHCIRLVALGCVARGAGAATIHVRRYVRFAEREPRRATVHDAAERRTVALAEGRDAEQLAESITG